MRGGIRSSFQGKDVKLVSLAGGGKKARDDSDGEGKIGKGERERKRSGTG